MAINDTRGERFSNPQNETPFSSLFHDFRPTIPASIEATWAAAGNAISRALQIKPVYASFRQQLISDNRPLLSGVSLDFSENGMPAISAQAQWTEEQAYPLPSFQSFQPQKAPGTALEITQSEQPKSIIQTGAPIMLRVRHDPVRLEHVIPASLISPNPRYAQPHIYQIVVSATRERSVGRLIDIVKIIDPRITNIIPLNEYGSENVYVDIGSGRLLPLTSMGTGFINLLHIAAYIFQKDVRVIVIDEIEDGIYYMAFRDVAASLIDIAVTFDLQLFITTHSGEMINAFADAAADRKFREIAALRLTRTNDILKVAQFDSSDLSNARDIELDVR